MNTDRIIIIGGGLAGVTSLAALAQRGRPALLLDAAAALGTGASHANGGMLTASMSDPWNSPGAAWALLASLTDPYAALKLRLSALPGLAGWGLRFLRNSAPSRHAAATSHAFALARRSVELTLELERGLPAHEPLARDGTLKVFATREAARGTIELARRLAPEGLRYEVLDRDGILAREPELREAQRLLSCGVYYPDDVCGDALAFVQAIAARARQAGAGIRLGARVRRICLSRGRVSGVELEGGEVLPAGAVVVATGVAAPGLTRRLGVRLPIKPAKGYSVTVGTDGWASRPRLPVIDDAMHAAVVPLGDALRFVGTAEFAGFDRTIEPARVENLFRLFARLFPHLEPRADRARAVAWAGLRPMSADGLPFIGAAGPDGLWINAGHGHLGWTMAAGSAELLADLMLGAAPSVDPRPYRADR